VFHKSWDAPCRVAESETYSTPGPTLRLAWKDMFGSNTGVSQAGVFCTGNTLCADRKLRQELNANEEICPWTTS